jgi:hypothetical protein
MYSGVLDGPEAGSSTWLHSQGGLLESKEGGREKIHTYKRMPVSMILGGGTGDAGR